MTRDSLIASRWELHLACGHVRDFLDPDRRGAPLVTAFCKSCGHWRMIVRRFKDGHETC